jgi:hypothetical protein
MWTVGKTGMIQLYASPNPVHAWYDLPETRRPAKKRVNPEEVVESFVPESNRWRDPS